MSAFSIRVDSLRVQQNQLSEMQRQIMEISEDVNTIRANITGMSAVAEMEKSLNENAQQLVQNAQSVGVLATALGSAADWYSKTESEIIGTHASNSDIKMVNTDMQFENIFSSAMDNFLIRINVDVGQTFIENLIGEKGAEVIADALMEGLKRSFPQLFIDRGLLYALASGGSMVLAEPPSWLASVIRSGSKILAPSIGAAFDYSLQRLRGEDSGDALVKTGAHTLIGIGTRALGMAAGAKIGAMIGTAIPVPGVGTVIGGVLGAAGSVAFDYVYDNREVIANTITDTVSGVGEWFGDRIEDAGNIIEDAGQWISDTGAMIGDAFSNLGNAFSFSW